MQLGKNRFARQRIIRRNWWLVVASSPVKPVSVIVDHRRLHKRIVGRAEVARLPVTPFPLADHRETVVAGLLVTLLQGHSVGLASSARSMLPVPVKPLVRTHVSQICHSSGIQIVTECFSEGMAPHSRRRGMRSPRLFRPFRQDLAVSGSWLPLRHLPRE
jgi:hypothetical protein